MAMPGKKALGKKQHSSGRQSPLDNYVGYRLRRVSAIVMVDLSNSLAPLNLRPSDASILLHLRENPGSSQSSVGRSLGIKSANMAPIISSLSGRGYCVQTPTGGRSSAIKLTRSGVAIAKSIQQLIEGHEERCFGHFSADQRRQIGEILESILRKDLGW